MTTETATKTTLTETQREVLSALTARDGWTDCGIWTGCYGKAKPKAFWQAFVGKRRVKRTTYDKLLAAGWIARTAPFTFSITDAGRAAL